jgi:hypothetical protein
MSQGGLFVRTSSPTAIGKRLSLEIVVLGEAASWPALGRVLWTRERDEGEDRPAGMGVKLIDVEEDVAAAIGRLVATREPTEPGVGKGGAPVRERTILGVGISTEAAPEGVPSAAPDREPTPQGAGGEQEPAGREASIAIDLVAKKPESRPPAPAATAEPPESRGRAGVALVLLLVVAAIAGYVPEDRGCIGTPLAAPAMRDDRDHDHRSRPRPTTTTTATATTTTTTTTTMTATATTAADASANSHADAASSSPKAPTAAPAQDHRKTKF